MCDGKADWDVYAGEVTFAVNCHKKYPIYMILFLLVDMVNLTMTILPFPLNR